MADKLPHACIELNTT